MRGLNELTSSNVKWCCDLQSDKLERMKKFYPLMRATGNYKEVLHDSDVQAVIVSTPASTHFRIVKDCLEEGKHVLVEKPFTIQCDQAEELCRIARNVNKVLMVGHIYIYHPAVRKIKELISNNGLGKIYYMYFVRTGFGPIRSDVNALWDLAPHDISMALYLLGAEPKRVIATGTSYLQNNIEDVVTMTMYFPNNVMVIVHVSWLDAAKTRRLHIVGNKKMLVFDDVENLETIRVFDKGISREYNTLSYGEFRLQLRDGDIYVPRVEPIEPLKSACQHFIDCIQNGNEPITNGENGLKVVRVLEAAQQSLKNNSAPAETYDI